MKPNVNVSYFLSNYELLMIFYKIWSNLGWPEDVESVWNFWFVQLLCPRSQCDLASHHIVVPIFAEGFLVHSSQMTPCFWVWACKFWKI
jgi:hypothetical protein